jgi:hypothetical protein
MHFLCDLLVLRYFPLGDLYSTVQLLIIKVDLTQSLPGNHIFLLELILVLLFDFSLGDPDLSQLLSPQFLLFHVLNRLELHFLQ